MLITSRRAAICQSVAEVYLTGVAPLGAVSHRLNFNFCMNIVNGRNCLLSDIAKVYMRYSKNNLPLTAYTHSYFKRMVGGVKRLKLIFFYLPYYYLLFHFNYFFL